MPVYSIFTNAQLAAMAERRILDAASLREIEGLGQARIDKYGARFLALMVQTTASQQTAP